MTILEMIAEWNKGCSESIGPSGDQHRWPEYCPLCTRALIDAIERRAELEATTCFGVKIDEEDYPAFAKWASGGHVGGELLNKYYIRSGVGTL